MNKKRGFTLIELLVVIAIIALLMSILMPALSKVRKQAMSVVCRARMKQWGVIFSMYTGDNDGFFHSREVGTDFGYSRMWPYTYKKMYNDAKMRFCPTAVNPALDTGVFGTWNWTAGGSYYPTTGNLLIPGEREYEKKTGNFRDGFFTGSFGMNRWVEDMKGGEMGKDPGFWRRTDVRGGDKVDVLLDCQYLYYWSDNYVDPPSYSGAYSEEMYFVAIDRHLGNINICYLDCSARKTGLKELWTLKHNRGADTCGPWTICSFGGGLTGKKACEKAWNEKAAWMSKMPVY